MRPVPADPDTLVGEHARAPPLPSLRRARGSDRLAVNEGVLSPELPRAQGGDKTAAPMAPAVTSGSRVLRIEMLSPGVAGASTLRLAGGAADVHAIRLHHEHHSQAHNG